MEKWIEQAITKTAGENKISLTEIRSEQYNKNHQYNHRSRRI
jgi:hypothetical protein